jgi:hypothetical protein
MTKKNIQCSLAALWRTTTLWAQGQREFDGVVSSRTSQGPRCCELMKDDGAAGLGMARPMASCARERCWVHNVVGSGRTTLLWAREWHRWLGDDACVVDGATGSGLGRWWRAKGLNNHREQQCGGSEEDSTMAWRCQGGLKDGTDSGEVDDGAGSREIFGGKFWQPDGMSESLRRLGFANHAHQFIYRGTTVATCISDISRAVATMIRISIAPI